jgi:DNA-binding response OmpR family regulator
MAMPAPAHILIVDDEPPLVQLVSGYLRRDGYEVHTARDGAREWTIHLRAPTISVYLIVED